ncbi:MAG: SIS domain-containing protein [Deltaproteobacteria bacterium]|nr:SIS domain-containing protein [Deltaproteobacteria bacterium]
MIPERQISGWIAHIGRINSALDWLSVCDNKGNELEVDIALEMWKNLTLQIRDARQTVFLMGNGASASMASHVSADLAKNAHVRTEVFSDLSLITAIANDLGYEEVFAEPLRRRISKDDMVVAISSSGQSPNILKACLEAIKLQGRVVTLSAMKPDNPLRYLGMFNFYVPAEIYGLAETCHTAILHYWIDLVSGENARYGL